MTGLLMRKYKILLILIPTMLVFVSLAFIIYNSINHQNIMKEQFKTSSQVVAEGMFIHIQHRIRTNIATGKYLGATLINHAKVIENLIPDKNVSESVLANIMNQYSIKEIRIYDKGLEVLYSKDNPESQKGMGQMANGRRMIMNRIAEELFQSDEQYLSTFSLRFARNPKGWRLPYGKNIVFTYRMENNLALVIFFSDISDEDIQFNAELQKLDISRMPLPPNISYVKVNNLKNENEILINKLEDDNYDNPIAINPFDEHKEIIFSNEHILEIEKKVSIENYFKGYIIVGINMDNYKKLKTTNMLNSFITASVFLILLIGLLFFLLRVERYSLMLKSNQEKYDSLILMTNQVAHEIRNPLNSLSLLAQQIAYEKDEEGVRSESIKILYDKIDMLDKVVKDFSFVTKDIFLEKSLTNLENLISDIVSHFKLEYPKMTFETKLMEIPQEIDAIKFRQAISNLMLNSIQATNETGRISVSLIQKGNKTIITITDNGNGIPEKIIQNLYQPFQTTKANGTGLGLTIVKKIIEAHNGNLKIENLKQGGVKAIISIPQK